MKRFDIYLVNLDPTQGSEIRKTRPCVIISPDEMNNYIKNILRNKLNEELEHIYNVTMNLVSKKTGLSLNLFSDNCPYSLEQLLDDNWYPEK